MYRSNGREKNPGDRVRRNPETYVIDYVEWDGETHGPDLPDNISWCDQTKIWWSRFRVSACAMVMTETDWDFMLDTALLHNALWEPHKETGEGKPKWGAVSMTQLASEIRQRVAKFGVTYEDRKKLRMSVETPQTMMDAERAIEVDAEKAIDYVEMLNKSVADKQADRKK